MSSSIFTRPLPVSRPALLVFSLAAALAAPALAQSGNDSSLIPVVVTASRIAQSQAEAIPSTTVITQEMIQNKQVRDVPSLLKSEAGLNVTDNGGAGKTTSVFLRGAESRHVLILLDGVPLRDATMTGTPVEIQHMHPDQIDRIEITRGNVSAIYGSGAIGGVIQIFTKQGEGPTAITASTEYGTDRTTKLNAGVSGKHEKTRFALSATRTRTEGFSAAGTKLDNPGWGTGANQDKDGNRDISVSASLSTEYLKGHEVGLRVYGHDNKTDYDSAYDNPQDRHWSESQQKNFALFSKNRFTENWQSTLTASHSNFDRDHFRQSLGMMPNHMNKYEGSTSMLQWGNEIALAKDWIVTAGADVQREKGESDSGTSRNYSESRTNYAVYAGLNGRLGNHSLQVNARYDHVGDSDARTTGYLGYGYNVTPEWKLVASASTSFLAPTLFQLHDSNMYSGSNRKLKSEKARTYEGGIQYHKNTTLVRATAFYTRTNDLIAWRPDYPNAWTGLLYNVDEAENTGFELTAQTRIHGIDIRGNILIQNPTNRETNKRLFKRPKQMANLSLSKTWGKFYLGGDVHYESNRLDYGVNDRTTKLGSYALVNLNARYQFTKEIAGYVRLENILDKEYETTFNYNQQDRAIFAGLQFKFR